MAFNLFGKKTLSIGVDLGADSVKLVCLMSSKSGYQLIAHALIQKSQMQSLKEFLNHPELHKAEVRIAIQDPNIKIQKLTIPIVPSDELEQIVTWALRDTINIPIEDYVVRFHESRSNAILKTQTIMAFAIDKKQMPEWLKFIDDAGITNPDLAEPDIQSLANLVAHNYGLKEDDRYAIIDIGKTQSQMAVVSQDGIEFYRPLSGVGGDQLASNISIEMGVTPEEAERLVIELANKGSCEKQDQILDIASRYCSKFCVQAQYAIENYLTQDKERPITNLILSGGGARVKGLKEQIQETLHFPTDLIDPFAQLNLGRFGKKDFENFKTLYAVAAGLAL